MIPTRKKMTHKQRLNIAKQEIASIQVALESYHAENPDWVEIFDKIHELNQMVGNKVF